MLEFVLYEISVRFLYENFFEESAMKENNVVSMPDVSGVSFSTPPGQRIAMEIILSLVLFM